MKKAKENSERMRPGVDRFMTAEEIRLKPLRRYEGPVHVVSRAGELRAAVAILEKESLLGFDTESKPTFHKGEKNPPALIQLAGANAVYIFQLNCLKFPRRLQAILANANIIKAGVAVREDIVKLRDLRHFEPAGFVDLAVIARNVGVVNQGLRGLAAVVLGFRISKNTRVSNWAVKILTPAQIRYAATDAWVSRELHMQLCGNAGCGVSHEVI